MRDAEVEHEAALAAILHLDVEVAVGIAVELARINRDMQLVVRNAVAGAVAVGGNLADARVCRKEEVAVGLPKAESRLLAALAKLSLQALAPQ